MNPPGFGPATPPTFNPIIIPRAPAPKNIPVRTFNFLGGIYFNFIIEMLYEQHYKN